MTVEEAIRALLLASPSVADIVAERVYPDVADQGTEYPCIVIGTAAVDDVFHLEGPSGLANHRVQLDQLAERKAGAVALAERVRVLLNGYQGVVGASYFSAIRRLNSFSRYIDGPNVYAQTTDYACWFQEGTQ